MKDYSGVSITDPEGRVAWDAALARMLGRPNVHRIEVGGRLQLRMVAAMPRALGVDLAFLEHQEWQGNVSWLVGAQ